MLCARLQIKEILVEESNVQPVNSPVTVCRSLHAPFLLFDCTTFV